MGAFRSRLNWTNAAIAILAFAVLGASTAFAATRPPTALRKPKLTKVSLLYVLGAGRAILRPDGKATYALHLKGVDRHAVWFSDRPLRRSGATPVSRFAGSWKSLGFVADPPNAALDYTDATGRRRTAIFELSAPRYAAHAGTLTFKARLLDPETITAPNLADHARAADLRPPVRLADPSLFIDDSAGEAPVLDNCVLAPEAMCPRSDFSGADLAGIDLHYGVFWDSSWEGADLSGTNLMQANLGGGFFKHADLAGANLSGASAAANFVDADLKGANLERGFFREASFENADLENADLEHADLEGAFLTGANITGANFGHADVCNMVGVEGTVEEECP
jgi:hypothetical protein